MKTLLKYYWLVTIITIFIWALVGLNLGIEALTLCVILTLLEITFSADNAVVNSRVLVTLSSFWQNMFMTVGIFLAVFVVRFILPIVIVMIGAELPFDRTLELALSKPADYAKEFDKASPVINSFGAMFLLMVALSFFANPHKKKLWLTFIEKPFVRLARALPHLNLIVAGLILVVTTLMVPQSLQPKVALSMASAILLFSGLRLVNYQMEAHQKKYSLAALKVGLPAFIAFIYLQILDASFSLDGVIGAFALTDNIIIIMAGLGAGAIWVREMTLHMVQTKVLTHYKYLEHGANWAIAVLGSIMLLKLHHIELPEVVVGLVGLVFVVFALISSRQSKVSPVS